MANYTIKLGDYLQQLIINDKYSRVQDIVNINPYTLESDPYKVVKSARSKFFTFEYPLYKAEHKIELETKILTHYYQWELCVEMPLYFKTLMRNTLNEKMPYYNKLYELQELNFKPFDNIDIIETLKAKGKNTAENSGSSTLKTNAKDKYTGSYEERLRESDTPQGKLADIDDEYYMSKYNKNNNTENNIKDNETTGENSNQNKTTGDYENSQEKITKGNNGKKSKSQLVLEYQKAILNVDEMIIKELQPLFIQLFD